MNYYVVWQHICAIIWEIWPDARRYPPLSKKNAKLSRYRVVCRLNIALSLIPQLPTDIYDSTPSI